MECKIVTMSTNIAQKVTLYCYYQDYLYSLLSPSKARATIRDTPATTSSFSENASDEDDGRSDPIYYDQDMRNGNGEQSEALVLVVPRVKELEEQFVVL